MTFEKKTAVWNLGLAQGFQTIWPREIKWNSGDIELNETQPATIPLLLSTSFDAMLLSMLHDARGLRLTNDWTNAIFDAKDMLSEGMLSKHVHILFYYQTFYLIY